MHEVILVVYHLKKKECPHVHDVLAIPLLQLNNKIFDPEECNK